MGSGGLKFMCKDAVFLEEKEKAKIIKTNKHKPYSNRIDDTVEVKTEERGPVKRLL